jgi:uncharacterized protein (TIGR02246 family)
MGKEGTVMMYKQIVLAFVIAPLLCTPLIAHGDDLAEVQAVFDKDLRLFNAQNSEAFSGSAHEDVVLFGILSPFATKGKEALQRLVQGYFADHTRIMFRTVNPKFFILNTSAVAWGAYTITEYPKIGPRETIHGRYTFTYAKTDGKWQLVALHLSPLQGY